LALERLASDGGTRAPRSPSPLDVLLRGGETSLGAFLTQTVLQDTGRLFDDGASIVDDELRIESSWP